MNGMKVGRWDVLHERNQIGGGSYDLEGNQKKIGDWVELDDGFFCGKYNPIKVTYNGQYNINGMKVGRWEILYRKQDEKDYIQMQIYQRKVYSGGSYDNDGNQKKIGKWIELVEGFNDEKQIIYNGQYNINGVKIERWDILFCQYNWQGYIQIGGGSYDNNGDQKKIGKWVELGEGFYLNNLVTYNGEYNMNGMKVGRWEIMYRKYGEKEYRQMQILYKQKQYQQCLFVCVLIVEKRSILMEKQKQPDIH
ncbi:unnamed protein product [Paramecium sonneborni]|uniref:MORN repeat protein n=1 Tax=Paramecium sonneborni TaxID=65129 RepID=A0A8S1P041_9CILI|nr:unnamed protein product [Paramecium sonneborni]